MTIDPTNHSSPHPPESKGLGFVGKKNFNYTVKGLADSLSADEYRQLSQQITDLFNKAIGDPANVEQLKKFKIQIKKTTTAGGSITFKVVKLNYTVTNKAKNITEDKEANLDTDLKSLAEKVSSVAKSIFDQRLTRPASFTPEASVSTQRHTSASAQTASRPNLPAVTPSMHPLVSSADEDNFGVGYYGDLWDYRGIPYTGTDPAHPDGSTFTGGNPQVAVPDSYSTDFPSSGHPYPLDAHASSLPSGSPPLAASNPSGDSRSIEGTGLPFPAPAPAPAPPPVSASNSSHLHASTAPSGPDQSAPPSAVPPIAPGLKPTSEVPASSLQQPPADPSRITSRAADDPSITNPEPVAHLPLPAPAPAPAPATSSIPTSTTDNPSPLLPSRASSEATPPYLPLADSSSGNPRPPLDAERPLTAADSAPASSPTPPPAFGPSSATSSERPIPPLPGTLHIRAKGAVTTPPATHLPTDPTRSSAISPSLPQGITNPRNNCFMNASLQMIMGNPTLKALLSLSVEAILRSDLDPNPTIEGLKDIRGLYEAPDSGMLARHTIEEEKEKVVAFENFRKKQIEIFDKLLNIAAKGPFEEGESKEFPLDKESEAHGDQATQAVEFYLRMTKKQAAEAIQKWMKAYDNKKGLTSRQAILLRLAFLKFMSDKPTAVEAKEQQLQLGSDIFIYKKPSIFGINRGLSCLYTKQEDADEFFRGLLNQIKEILGESRLPFEVSDVTTYTQEDSGSPLTPAENSSLTTSLSAATASSGGRVDNGDLIALGVGEKILEKEQSSPIVQVDLSSITSSPLEELLTKKLSTPTTTKIMYRMKTAEGTDERKMYRVKIQPKATLGSDEFFIQLKRFTTDSRGVPYKNSIPTPLETLNVKIGEDTFDIDSLVCHIGALDSGHYISYRKEGEKWYLLDDATSKEVSQDEVLSAFNEGSHETPYLIHFKKRAT